jgi:hypothetical protein
VKWRGSASEETAGKIDPLSATRQPIVPISWVAQLLLFLVLCDRATLGLKELPGFAGFGDMHKIDKRNRRVRSSIDHQ